MGIRVSFGDYDLIEVSDYTVEEASSPLAGNDTSGSTGQIKLTIPHAPKEFRTALNRFGSTYFIGANVQLADSRKGYTLGTIESIDDTDNAQVQITCATRLGRLNAYNVQAQPFIGTLGDAFDYYVSLSGLVGDIFCDPTIASRDVIFPGFNGELWYYMKQAAASQDAEISLVSGVVLLRPIRQRVAAAGRDVSVGIQAGGSQLAQAVEVYQYNNEAVVDELVYPPGGWTSSTEIITVNAGETVEQVLQLSSSVTSIDQPVMMSFVDRYEDSQSVYTIIGDDGLDVDPDMWAAHGGQLSVTINPDTTSLTVKIVAATEIPVVNSDTFSTTFSVALASDFSGNRYSTLRIIGTGVRYNKVKKRYRTGVTSTQTGTDVGVTVDSPFVSTAEDAFRVGVRTAKEFAGYSPRANGTLLSINRRGDTGDATFPSYGEVQTSLATAIGGTPTYAQVQTFYVTTLGLAAYGSVQSYWYLTVVDTFENQVFGNVNGARIFNKKQKRWFRIRSGSLGPGLITYTADDDLTLGDMDEFWAGLTYGDVQDFFEQDPLYPYTYKQVELAGMYNGS